MLAADLTLNYDLASDSLQLIDNADGGRILQIDRLDADTPFVIQGTSGDDLVTVDLTTPFSHPVGVHLDAGTGDDQLTLVGTSVNDLQHLHQTSDAGMLTLDGASFSFAGVENVDHSAVNSDTQTITLANDANLTLTQNDDGTLQTSVQYAFDADTDLSGLAGTDGFAIKGSDASSTGQSVSTAGDVNQDGFADVIIGAPALDQAYVVFGTDAGIPANIDLTRLDGSDGFTMQGPSGQQVGFSVTGGSDMNGDGVDDVVVGAPGPDGNLSAGSAYVLFGSSAPFAASIDLSSLDGSNGFAVQGIASGDGLGWSLGLADDVNGDELGDLILGAPGADPDTARADAGQVYLLFGSEQGFPVTFDIGSVDGKSGFALNGAAAGDAAGSSIAAIGDLNNDGIGDVAVGAPGADSNGQDAGASYVFFGALDFAVAEGLASLFFDTGPITSLADAQSAISNAMPTSSFLAYQVDYPNSDSVDTVDANTTLPDFLGMNAEDIEGGDSSTIDGSVFEFNGYLHVPVPGTYSFEVGSSEGFSLSIDNTVVAEFDGTRPFGTTTGTHAFVGSGFFPISLLYYTSDSQAGIELKSDLGGTLEFVTREQLFTAPPVTTIELTDLDGNTGFAITGAAAGDALGTSVGRAGDVNGDGPADVILGAPGADANGSDSGQAYVIFGELFTTVDSGFAPVLDAGNLNNSVGFAVNGAAAGDAAGTAVGTAGDLNDDGISDLTIGKVNSGGGSSAGAVHVVFGNQQLAANGPIALETLDGVIGFTASTGGTNDLLGTSISGNADINADGIDDLIMGAPGASTSYVLFGRSAGGTPVTTQHALPTTALLIDGEAAQANIILGTSPSPGPPGQNVDSDQLNFNGANFDAKGKNVTVSPGVTISTRQIGANGDPPTADSLGNSGNISLHTLKTHLLGGGDLHIGQGANIFAQVEDGSAFAPGKVEILATNTVPALGIPGLALLDEGKHTATITIDEGATILGGEIDIDATAGVTDFTKSMPVLAKGVTSGSLGAASFLGKILQLPVSVQVSVVESEITIGKAGGEAVTLTGTGDVSIGTDATAVAKGNAAFWWTPKSTQTWGGAVGFWWAKATSTIDVHSNVSVESTSGNVSIAAELETTAGGSSRVAQNVDAVLKDKGAGTPSNPNNIGVAIGVAYTSATSRVTVEQGASVIADNGNVSITSDGTDSSKFTTTTKSYSDGKVGLTLSFAIAEADIHTNVNGTVRAGGTPVGQELTFDPFISLDTTANTINLGPNHGYQTGDRVIYSSGQQGAIDGLQQRATYYVIMSGNDPNLIQLAETENDAHTGNAIDLADNPTLTGGGLTLPFTQIGSAGNWIDFGFRHGLNPGDAVVYSAAAGKQVNGLVDGQTYYAVLVQGDESGALLQLANNPAGSDIVQLDNSPTFSVEGTGNALTVESIDARSGIVTFVEQHQLQAGDAIHFHAALGVQLLDPLTEQRYADGATFFAIPTPSVSDPTQPDPNRIQLASTKDAAENSNGYTGAIALELDSSGMFGTTHTIQPIAAEGITVSSSLTEAYRVQNLSTLGGSENPVKQLARPEFWKSATAFRQSLYEQFDNPQLDDVANNDNQLDGKTDQSTIDLAGGLAFRYAPRSVQTVIGSHAQLQSAGDVDISAESAGRGNVIVESGATQSEKSNIKIDVGASISLALYDTTVRAIVNGGASIDAAGSISVDANSSQAFPAQVHDAKAFFVDFLWQKLKSDPGTTIGDFLSSMMFPFFTTGWAYTLVAPENTDVAVAFAVQIAVYDNVTESIVAPGAMINQDVFYQNDAQEVDIHAETNLQIVNMSGVFRFAFDIPNLFLNTLQNIKYKNIGEKFKKLANPLVTVGAQGKSRSWGTSFQWVDITNSTVAAIGRPSPVDNNGNELDTPVTSGAATVHTGKGGLTVTSHEEIVNIGFVDSSAKTASGKSSFAGSGAVLRHNPGQFGRNHGDDRRRYINHRRIGYGPRHRPVDLRHSQRQFHLGGQLPGCRCQRDLLGSQQATARLPGRPRWNFDHAFEFQSRPR